MSVYFIYFAMHFQKYLFLKFLPCKQTIKRGLKFCLQQYKRQNNIQERLLVYQWLSRVKPIVQIISSFQEVSSPEIQSIWFHISIFYFCWFFWSLMYVLIIFMVLPQTLPISIPLFFTNQFCVLFLLVCFKLQDESVFLKYSSMCGLALYHGYLTKSYTLRENYVSFSHQLSTLANSEILRPLGAIRSWKKQGESLFFTFCREHSPAPSRM